MARALYRLFIATAAVVFAVTGPLQAQGGLPAAEQTAVENVISGQIAAFKAGDGKAAFVYAAPRVQAQFGTPAGFMQAVKTRYEAVFAAAAVEFKPTKGSGDGLIQPVLVTGPDGKVYLALYLMQKLKGVWKIAGVSLTKTDQDAI